MPDVLQYLAWAPIHKYAAEILVAGEFHDLHLSCNETLLGRNISSEIVIITP
jgi:hypothetical protein